MHFHPVNVPGCQAPFAPRFGIRRRVSRWPFGTAALSLAALLGTFLNNAQAAPGTPGTPQPQIRLYFEDFENRPTPTLSQILTAYQGSAGPAQGERYTADPYWINGDNCNGYVFSANVTDSAFCTTARNSGAPGVLRNQAREMGFFHGLSAADAEKESVLGAYTEYNGPANAIQF